MTYLKVCGKCGGVFDETVGPQCSAHGTCASTNYSDGPKGGAGIYPQSFPLRWKLPPKTTILNCEKELKQFIDAMRYKLKKNEHKGKWEDLNLSTAISRLKDELLELEEAISRGSEIEIILEAADVANFAMMVANISMKNAAKED